MASRGGAVIPLGISKRKAERSDSKPSSDYAVGVRKRRT